MAEETDLAFTKKNLESLGVPAHGQRDSYRDDKVRGLRLVVYPTGRKNFILYRKVKGRPERILIGPFPDLSIEQARGKAHELFMRLRPRKGPHEFSLPDWYTLLAAGSSWVAPSKKPKQHPVGCLGKPLVY